MDIDTDLFIFAQAASAVAYLAKRGVLHRDVAARNCLLTDEDTLKIADFGSALGARVLVILVNTPVGRVAAAGEAGSRVCDAATGGGGTAIAVGRAGGTAGATAQRDKRRVVARGTAVGNCIVWQDAIRVVTSDGDGGGAGAGDAVGTALGLLGRCVYSRRILYLC